MKIMRGIGKVVKPFVNFPSWMGWKSIAATGKDIKDTMKTIATPQKATRTETYEEAVKRLGLSQDDIKQRMKDFKRMAYLYMSISGLLLIYAIYLLITLHLAAAFLSGVLCFLAGSLGLRQHFWYFQMKEQRLGCTLKQWFNSNFKRGQ